MITVYGKENCVACNQIKKHLDGLGVKYEYKDAGKVQEYVDFLASKGFYSLPVVEGYDKEGKFYRFQGFIKKYIDKLVNNGK